MTGAELLPVLDQIMLGVLVIGAIFGIIATVLVFSAWFVMTLLVLLDTLVSWTWEEVTNDEAILAPRFLFKHTEPEVILPYARQRAALEGVIVS